MVPVTSVELNFVIFRYLQESGFTHSAFAFGHEAGVTKSPIDESNSIPPGALVKLVQKGLQYMEMEANLSNTENDMDEDFSFFQPLDLITKDVYELQKIAKENKKNQHEARGKELDALKKGASCHVKHKEETHKILKIREKQDSEIKEKERVQKDRKRTRKK
ncbi:hypothetical protein ACJIZ3_008024 [Penstemon smallii]|uniref:LisH domain-containing protein n=1 Tax=Penstemon smallii TaxID=265156 RepID=A0ABD3T9L4_9LAMI